MRTRPNRLCVTILFFIFLFQSNGQLSDSTKRHLSFSINLFRIPLDEISLYSDYYINNRNSIGFNFGYIYPNPSLNQYHPFHTQDSYPGLVWTGIVSRANYRRYFWDYRSYFLCQLTYKSLCYNNKSLTNTVSGDDEYNIFTRSENAYQIGLDLLFGNHLLNTPNSKATVEFIYGFGLNYRERNYTTWTSSSTSYYVTSFRKQVPIGTFHMTQFFPTLTLGLKVGIVTHK